ncbi:MAG: homoserine dehydrogenase [Synergistaceae bacterium]|jgi:homoserine dehydrogenase|nr:homoserine dehydrogenase [Synergistaceae bacterium]
MAARIGLVGCGTVGTGLIELLALKSGHLLEKYGVEFKIIFVTDAVKGTVFSDSGLDPAEISGELERRRDLSESPHAREGLGSLPDLIKSAKLDMLCEATPTNYKTGEPGMTILRSALSSGVSAVTSSKGALGLDMAGLKKLASDNGAMLRFESSVMSGTPLISLVRGPLAGCEVSRVEGILNGTTNYILTEMGEGASYGDALASAQRLGYAEADPSGDVEGFDAAVKVCIMSAEFFGVPLAMGDVRRTGITGVTEGDVKRAAESGGRIKLIAGVERDGGSAKGYVAPRVLGSGNPLASISGATNAVSVTTDNLGTITISGPGAGKRETAQGLMADMIEIAMACGK